MKTTVVFKSAVTLARAGVLVAAVHMVSGCAVFMAANGDQREITTTNEDGTTTKKTVGAEPSTGRAILHGVMDGLTFGLWEVVATPGELVYQQTQKNEAVSK